jgi:hypothetical protein
VTNGNRAIKFTALVLFMLSLLNPFHPLHLLPKKSYKNLRLVNQVTLKLQLLEALSGNGVINVLTVVGTVHISLPST